MARTWVEIFSALADMQPGDIDKLSGEEAEVVRKVVDAVAKDFTLCLATADRAALDSALTKLATAKH